VYDIEDRLTEVWNGETGSGTLIATYCYDPFGRRLWKDVDGTRTCFVYSDEGLIGEYDGTGTELKTYGYVPDSIWTTDPLFQKVNGTCYWYQNDHLGTPQKLTAVNGAVAWSATYDSFGNILIDTETITNNLRFPGQYYDQETGLYYNYQRYYDPATGRYLRIDPQGDGINLYAYCFNNPIAFIDPMGLCVVKDVNYAQMGIGMLHIIEGTGLMIGSVTVPIAVGLYSGTGPVGVGLTAAVITPSFAYGGWTLFKTGAEDIKESVLGHSNKHTQKAKAIEDNNENKYW
jgi:RHS repeat-associated protein